jgi:hypothetical protein
MTPEEEALAEEFEEIKGQIIQLYIDWWAALDKTADALKEWGDRLTAGMREKDR